VPFSDLRASHVKTWVKAMKDKPLDPSNPHPVVNVRGVVRAAITDRFVQQTLPTPFGGVA
jgi:hypothetical protein